MCASVTETDLREQRDSVTTINKSLFAIGPNVTQWDLVYPSLAANSLFHVCPFICVCLSMDVFKHHAMCIESFYFCLDHVISSYFNATLKIHMHRLHTLCLKQFNKIKTCAAQGAFQNGRHSARKLDKNKQTSM